MKRGGLNDNVDGGTGELSNSAAGPIHVVVAGRPSDEKNSFVWARSMLASGYQDTRWTYVPTGGFVGF